MSRTPSLHFLPAHLRRTSIPRREPTPVMDARALQERLEAAFLPLAHALCVRPQGMTDDEWRSHSAAADDMAGLWAILMGGVLFCTAREPDVPRPASDARADEVVEGFTAVREAERGLRGALARLGEITGAGEQVADAEDRRECPWGIVSEPGADRTVVYFGVRPRVLDLPPSLCELAAERPEVVDIGRGVGLALCRKPGILRVVLVLVTLGIRNDAAARRESEKIR